jgi:hypothetical protein
MKQARIPRFTDRTKIGDQWTFVAIDPDTKLTPAYRVGKRHPETAVAFMADLSERLSNRVQISSHSLRSDVDAVERAFGADVDYGQIVKFLRCRADRAGPLCPSASDRRGAHSDRGKPGPSPHFNQPWARKIRMQLGGSANMFEEFPDKPKHMHWRTYNSLRCAHNIAEERTMNGLMRFVNRVHRTPS